MLSFLLRKLGYVSLKEHDLVIDRDGRARPRMVELPRYSFGKPDRALGSGSASRVVPASPERLSVAPASARPPSFGAVPEVDLFDEDDTEDTPSPRFAAGTSPMAVPAERPWNDAPTDPDLVVSPAPVADAIDFVLGTLLVEEEEEEISEADEWEWRMAIARAKSQVDERV